VFDFLLLRALFIAILALAAAWFRPAEIPAWAAAGAGIAIGCAAILIEMRLAKVGLKQIVGMITGLLAGLCCAALASVVLDQSGIEASPTLRFVEILILVLFAWFGAGIGFSKGAFLSLGPVSGETENSHNYKILDTSVIIDGRIADIAEAGFLDGTLLVPQFVLQELQTIADSADGLKRNRGRRGLDVLQRMQKMSHVKIEVTQRDFPSVKEVDMKLIELATVHQCPIVTNDFNLNKVAHVRGVQVLNINELANSVRPVVLPGELMRVFILKEGKEYNQGIAYLDDGTMVVVDNARRMISKTIDVSVTSVLQTTAGKMIFGKYDERGGHAGPPAATERQERSPLKVQALGE